MGLASQNSDLDVEADFNYDVAQVAKGAGASLFGKIGGRLLGVLGDIIAARLLGPSIFGLYAIGWTILRMVNLVAPLGLDKGVLRFFPQVLEKGRAAYRHFVLQALQIGAGFGLVAGLLFFLLAPWLANSVFGKPGLEIVFRFLAFAFPFTALLTVSINATRALQTVKYMIIIEDVGQPLVGLVFLGLLYLAGQRLKAVLASDVLSFVVPGLVAFGTVLYLFPSVRKSPAESTVPIRELILFSLPSSLAGVFGQFLTWADRLIVGYFRTSAESGIYQAASQSSQIFAIILASFGAMVVPMFVALYHRREMERLNELYRFSTKWALYSSVPVLMVIWLAPKALLSLFFGSAYGTGWQAMLILSFGQLINVGTGAVGPLLVMTGHQNKWLAVTGGAFLLNVALNVWLVPGLGIDGAAIATSLSLGLMFIAAILVLYRYTGLWPYDRRYLKGIVATLVPLVVLKLVPMHNVLSPVLNLLLIAIAASVMFILILIALRLDREELAFLALVVKRLRAMLGSRAGTEPKPDTANTP